MIEFINVSKSFKKDKILNELSFKIENNDFFIIQGSNGSGKTTIINLILNLYTLNKNDSGEIINDFKAISYMPDKFVFPSLVKSYDFLYDYFSGTVNKKTIDYFIERYKLQNKFICNLSKGNMIKIGLIKALAEDMDLYIFDEPLNGLDDESKKYFKEDLINLHQNNKTIVVVTHDVSHFKSCSNNILKLKEESDE